MTKWYTPHEREVFAAMFQAISEEIKDTDEYPFTTDTPQGQDANVAFIAWKMGRIDLLAVLKQFSDTATDVEDLMRKMMKWADLSRQHPPEAL